MWCIAKRSSRQTNLTDPRECHPFHLNCEVPFHHQVSFVVDQHALQQRLLPNTPIRTPSKGRLIPRSLLRPRLWEFCLRFNAPVCVCVSSNRVTVSTDKLLQWESRNASTERTETGGSGIGLCPWWQPFSESSIASVGRRLRCSTTTGESICGAGRART